MCIQILRRKQKIDKKFRVIASQCYRLLELSPLWLFCVCRLCSYAVNIGGFLLLLTRCFCKTYVNSRTKYWHPHLPQPVHTGPQGPALNICHFSLLLLVEIISYLSLYVCCIQHTQHLICCVCLLLGAYMYMYVSLF